MLFDKLNQKIPRGEVGATHSQTMDIDKGDGWKVRIKYPGKYGPDDYVVQIRSNGVWDKYKSFTHGDFFTDVHIKSKVAPSFMVFEWLPHAVAVVQGHADPHEGPDAPELPGIALEALNVGTQALAVCEFRRYPQGDDRGGGRYLPLNFTAAMLYGHWTADAAWDSMREGLPALKQLQGFRPFRHIDDVEFHFNSIQPLGVF